jgi:hypothetical protein
MAEQKQETESTYKHLSGDAHPDNKPPVTIVAPVSAEKTKEIEDAVNAELRASRLAAGQQQNQEASTNAQEQNLEDHTVPELKAIAEEKGIHLSWDANKQDIIKAIKKAK